MQLCLGCDGRTQDGLDGQRRSRLSLLGEIPGWAHQDGTVELAISLDPSQCPNRSRHHAATRIISR